MSSSRPHRWVILFLVTLLFSKTGLATSVRRVSIKEMIAASDLVFEGRVVQIQPRLAPDGSRIHTQVTFEILDIVKGTFPARKIELSFLGGKVGDLSLEISGMKMPTLGEKGIYFVETLKQRQVHPLYGWNQGHFLIVLDADGTERVRTQNNRRIIGVGSGSRKGGLSNGIASGIRVSAAADVSGLTVGEFKRKLRELMRASR